MTLLTSGDGAVVIRGQGLSLSDNTEGDRDAAPFVAGAPALPSARAQASRTAGGCATVPSVTVMRGR
jgi:hypothetical protein